MTEPVFKTIEVACDAAMAFTVFTEKIATWWPLDKNSLSAMEGKVAQSLSIEPSIGGKIIEIAHDGSPHIWGTVTRFDPGKRLTLDWVLASSADIEPTIVDVKFIDIGNGRARVELTHDNWQGHGDNAQNHRDNYNQGWVGVFEEAYAGACGR